MSEPVVPVLDDACTICRASLPKAEMVEIEGKWICAACKESFVQSIKEVLSLADLTLARSKKLLVMGRNAILPDRCIKCNAPANGQRLPRKLYWHPPMLYLLILASILIYALVAILARKKAQIDVGLCDRHVAKRRRAIWICWGLLLGSFGLIGLLVGMGYGEYAMIAIIVTVAGIIYGALATRVVSVHRIDKEYVWLKGASKEYLDALPEWVKPG